MKGKPNTIRLEEDLEPAVHEWLKLNEIEFSQLVDMALRDFIFKKQVIELKPVPLSVAKKSAKKMLRKYRDDLDQLK